MSKKNQKTHATLLNELDPNTMVYIGTDKGHSWIVIDTTSNIIERMDDIEVAARDNAEAELFSYCAKCNSLPEEIVYLQRECRIADETEIEEFENRLAAAEQKYVAAYNGRKKWTDILKNWVAFGERAVVDVYPHTVDIPGTSIIVKGHINGYLWWKDEKPSAEDINSTCTDEE